GIAGHPEDWRRRNAYYRWMHTLSRATEELKAVIPPGGSFLLVDEGQWGANVITGRRAIPFPERDGQYGGPPADDAAAITEFERLRQGGAGFMVFGWPAFWWLDYYEGFRAYLHSQFPRLVDNERLLVF